MIEYAYMQTAYEELMKFKMKKQFSWEKQTQVMTELRTDMNSEDFLASRLKIANSVEESSVIYFSEGIKYYWRGCVCERVENY